MLKIIYAGTPEFAIPALAALLHGEHELVAVFTQPDRPAGRGRKLQQSPVKAYALEHGLAILQPPNFKQQSELDSLIALQADLMVVAAYGLLLPPAVLSAPRLGCVNIHASLLPRWRGASPIQQALLAGDANSGITLMKMDQGLDTGDVISRRSLPIEPTWNAGDLQDKLAPIGAELLLEALADIDSALRQAQPQNPAFATYAPRIDKQQAQLDWQKPRATLQREVAAFNPWPVSFTWLDNENLRIWSANQAEEIGTGGAGEVLAHTTDGVFVGCADGALQVTELQFAGRKRGTAAQALNARNLTGARLVWR